MTTKKRTPGHAKKPSARKTQPSDTAASGTAATELPAGKSRQVHGTTTRGARPPRSDGRLLMGARSLRTSNGNTAEPAASGRSTVPNIEGLNRHIVELLQEDGRASLSSIAEELGVSEATVRSRVSRMRKANLIHFITVINPLALGYTAWAMLGIRVAHGAHADDVARYFSDCPEVVYVMRVAARYDLLAEIVCETPDDLRAFLDNHCYGSNDVASVEPMVGLGLYKSLFKWEQPVFAGNGNGAAQPDR